MAVRSQWKGMLSAGMLNVPVRLYGATEDANDIAFNNVHQECGTKVSAPKWCRSCNRELTPTEMVKGYPHGDGFILMEEADLAELPVPSLKAVTIDRFVDAAGLDPRRVEASYFLAPEGVGAKAFALLMAGLRGTGKAGIAKIAMRNREHLCLLQPFQDTDLILLQTLLWDNELRAADPYIERLPQVSEQERGVAVEFVRAMEGEADLSGERDEYAAALRERIENKIAGITPTPISFTPKKDAVTDLMEQLRASIGAAKAKKEKVAA